MNKSKRVAKIATSIAKYEREMMTCDNVTLYEEKIAKLMEEAMVLGIIGEVMMYIEEKNLINKID